MSSCDIQCRARDACFAPAYEGTAMQVVIELFLSLIGEASSGQTKPIVPWLDKAVWLVLATIILVTILFCFALVA